MKRKTKFMSIGCIVMLMVCMFGVTLNVRASESSRQVDGSYLTNDKESTGYDTKITRGADLLTGYSKITILANGNLYVGGSTIAAHTVDEVGITVTVERILKDADEDEAWEYYDGWQMFHKNADKLSTSKEIEDPESGYYYRVRCIHSAGNDMSSSYTDGVLIE